MKRLLVLIIVLTTLCLLAINQLSDTENNSRSPLETSSVSHSLNSSGENSITSVINSEQPLPEKKILSGITHTYQTFNNCGPASLSMTLSFYDVNKTQQEIGSELRPYQIPNGDNDDKSVTLEELAEYAQNLKFVTYHRPAGTMDILTALIANDIPVITRTWLKPDEDIGHYRVVKGYDLTNELIMQDDSLEGKDLAFSYEYFNKMWGKFNYEYLVIVPKEKADVVEDILGEYTNEKHAWEIAKSNAEKTLKENSQDVYARFNLSIAHYNLGNVSEAIKEFEEVEKSLSPKTLWYQQEPILAYLKAGNHERVFQLTDTILESGNRAYSELYVIRAKAYIEQGDIQGAKQELELAIKYNTHLKEAHDLRAQLN